MHFSKETNDTQTKIWSTLTQLNKLQEEIPAFYREDSEILQIDPQMLDICLNAHVKDKEKRHTAGAIHTFEVARKQKSIYCANGPCDNPECTNTGCITTLSLRTCTVTTKIPTKKKEEIKRDNTGAAMGQPINSKEKKSNGYFDEQGNFIIGSGDDSSSTGEDWTVVKTAKEKKKKQPKDKERPQVYTATRQNAVSNSPAHQINSSQFAPDGGQTDDEGFTVVKTKKARPTTRMKK